MVSPEQVYSLSENIHVLDKAFELYRLAYRQNDWKQAEILSDQIRIISERLYQKQLKWGDVLPISLKKPLVFYIGYGSLSKSIVYQRLGQYELAKECIEHYANLDQYHYKDEDSQEVVSRFKTFARSNSYAVDLLSGNKDLLEEYMEFIQQEEEEILPGLITMLEAANINNWNIDAWIDTYVHRDLEMFSTFEDIGNRVYYIKLLNQLIIYNQKKENICETIDFILEYFTVAVNIDMNKEFIVNIAIFESNRLRASKHQLQRYENIMEGVLLNEKIDDINLLSNSVV